ncbi:MAG: hypothetical protein KDK99_07770 [Verrucomicrobiales bacterium]|nr:hypothetical protein [Verrucomicrobiales bacterium]
MQPSTVQSHRAFMVITLTMAACMIFGLAVGWQWYFKKVKVRERFQEIEKRSAESRAAQDGFANLGSTGAGLSPTLEQPSDNLEDLPGKLNLSQTQPFSPQETPFHITRTVPRATQVEVLPLESAAADLARAEELLDRYFRTEEWEDRVALVWNPTRVRPLMENYYVSQMASDPVRGALVARGRFRVNGMEILHFSFSSTRPLGSMEIACRRMPGSDAWGLDWESYVGYGERSWAQLKSERPTEPILMRVFVRLGDYYNYEFADDQKYLCVRMLSEDGQDLVHAYTERGMELATFLIGELGVGNSAMKGFTVRVAYPPNAQSDSCLWLREIVSTRWLLDAEEMGD